MRDWGLHFASSLVQFKPPAADEGPSANSREYLLPVLWRTIATTKISGENEGRYFCQQLVSLISQMEKLTRRRRRQPASKEPEVDWSPDAHEEVADVSETGTIDELWRSQRSIHICLTISIIVPSGRLSYQVTYRTSEKIATDYARDPYTKQRMLAQPRSGLKGGRPSMRRSWRNCRQRSTLFPVPGSGLVS